jgi:hypothetical protein
MQVNGPIIEVELAAPAQPGPASQSQAGAASSTQQGTTGAQIIRGRALLDTGASNTFIDVNVAQQLALQATGTAQCQSASHPYSANQYAVAYRFVGVPNFSLIAVADSPNLSAQNLVMLMGRDILAGCILVYNGLAGTFSLSW